MTTKKSVLNIDWFVLTQKLLFWWKSLFVPQVWWNASNLDEFFQIQIFKWIYKCLNHVYRELLLQSKLLLRRRKHNHDHFQKFQKLSFSWWLSFTLQWSYLSIFTLSEHEKWKMICGKWLMSWFACILSAKKTIPGV